MIDKKRPHLAEIFNIFSLTVFRFVTSLKNRAAHKAQPLKNEKFRSPGRRYREEQLTEAPFPSLSTSIRVKFDDVDVFMPLGPRISRESFFG